MKKKIVYLGEMTWSTAIHNATAIGLVVPNHLLMSKMLRFLQGQGDILGCDILPHKFFTSTTYECNIYNFVLPIDKPITELQTPNNWSHRSKTNICKAYAVSPDMTETDIDTFNFYFEKQ